MAPKKLDQPWSKEEDEKLLALVRMHGRKWRPIGAAMPGRSHDALRNRHDRLSMPDDLRAARAKRDNEKDRQRKAAAALAAGRKPGQPGNPNFVRSETKKSRSGARPPGARRKPRQLQPGSQPKKSRSGSRPPGARRKWPPAWMESVTDETADQISRASAEMYNLQRAIHHLSDSELQELLYLLDEEERLRRN